MSQALGSQLVASSSSRLYDVTAVEKWISVQRNETEKEMRSLTARDYYDDGFNSWSKKTVNQKKVWLARRLNSRLFGPPLSRNLLIRISITLYMCYHIAGGSIVVGNG